MIPGAREGQTVPASYKTPVMLLIMCQTPIYANKHNKVNKTWALLYDVDTQLLYSFGKSCNVQALKPVFTRGVGEYHIISSLYLTKWYGVSCQNFFQRNFKTGLLTGLFLEQISSTQRTFAFRADSHIVDRNASLARHNGLTKFGKVHLRIMTSINHFSQNIYTQFSFLCSVLFFCSFFFWPLFCLSFCDLRILIIPLLSSNLSYIYH